jgi:alkylation response protein AidB-like acyl-CoA dehydrogenase
MTLSMQELLRRPGLPSLYEELCVGRLRWDLVTPFPVQDPADRAAGDAVVAEALELVKKRVDPDTVEATRSLPPGLVEDLRDRGFLKLATDPALGGRGLSYLNVFRTVTAVAGWSVPVALVLAVEAGIGASALEPLLPDGPLREEVRARLARGVVTGGANTEPTGATNAVLRTTATPVEDGAAYEITGEKVHIGNAPIADWMSVTARLDGRTRVFFFDTRSPGFHVKSHHEFMGIKGFPNAALTFDRVRVPREWLLVEDGLDRLTPTAVTVAVRGRMFLIVAPALALARASAGMAREFALRRSVNGRGLGEYDEIQRQLTETLGEIFAIETLAEWGLLADHQAGTVNSRLEQMLAKNVASQGCWRVVDRAMSLLASEGFEVAASKDARGVPPLPMERVFRDARGLRISGGVDFMLDVWLGRYILSSWYLDPDAAADPAGDLDLDDSMLAAGNRAHLSALRTEVAAFARTCGDLVRAYPDPEVLYARERTLILVSQLLNELTTMVLVLARGARLAGDGHPMAQDLADAYCRSGWLRVGEIRRELAGHLAGHQEPASEEVIADLSREWLHGDGLAFLRHDATDAWRADRPASQGFPA